MADLLTAAEATLRLSERVGPATLGAHLRQLAKSKGLSPEAYVQSVVKAPELPRELEFLWRAFREMSTVRRSGLRGPESISHVDIAAWCGLYGIRLEPWEVDAIRALDEMMLRLHDARAPKKRSKKAK